MPARCGTFYLAAHQVVLTNLAGLSSGGGGIPMKSFEEMFGVRTEHRLALVKSRSVGGDLPIERWDGAAWLLGTKPSSKRTR